MTCAHDPPCPGFPEHRERQRKEWKQAASARAKALRNGRVRRKPEDYQAGMNVITPVITRNREGGV